MPPFMMENAVLVLPHLSLAEVSLTTRPDVEHVAVPGAEIVDPARRTVCVRSGALTIDRRQGRLHIGLHLAAVAADIDDCAFLDQLPDAILLRGEQMLHIGLRPLHAREGSVQFAQALGGERLQLVGVDEVLLRMATAEEQHRRSKAGTPRLAIGALLQEPAEWGQPRARPDHDDRDRVVVRQAETGLGLAHGGMDRVARAAARQIARADATIDAAA